MVVSNISTLESPEFVELTYETFAADGSLIVYRIITLSKKPSRM